MRAGGSGSCPLRTICWQLRADRSLTHIKLDAHHIAVAALDLRRLLYP
jgi:hypothetical protein